MPVGVVPLRDGWPIVVVVGDGFGGGERARGAPAAVGSRRVEPVVESRGRVCLDGGGDVNLDRGGTPSGVVGGVRASAPTRGGDGDEGDGRR